VGVPTGLGVASQALSGRRTSDGAKAVSRVSNPLIWQDRMEPTNAAASRPTYWHAVYGDVGPATTRVFESATGGGLLTFGGSRW
jgi:hypothetical protein